MELSQDVFFVDDNQISDREPVSNRNRETSKLKGECSFNAIEFERPRTVVSKVNMQPFKNSTNLKNSSNIYKKPNVPSTRIEVGMHRKSSSHSNNAFNKTPSDLLKAGNGETKTTKKAFDKSGCSSIFDTNPFSYQSFVSANRGQPYQPSKSHRTVQFIQNETISKVYQSSVANTKKVEAKKYRKPN